MRNPSDLAPPWLLRTGVHGLAALPDGVLRRLAGAPLRVDGQEFDPSMRMIMRLARLTADEDLERQGPEAARAMALRQAAIGAVGVDAVAEALDVTMDGGLRGRLFVPYGAAAPPGPLL